MGIGPFHKSSCCGCGGQVAAPAAAPVPVSPYGTPDPRRFEILEVFGVGRVSVLRVRYPDARNFEGVKILVYRWDLDLVRVQPELDPHFCDNPKCVSPFARFAPTDEGWEIACDLARVLAQEEG
jgi:hypothetical protein